ncbi:hypothetical protein BB559_002194 [Furculomyces boomerangus]|uniref:Pre-mRNA-splicing factor n=2 Tax=Furculomyces boomerangus TaxID=61424 RepID=A0A2T9YXA4_9FUNG|nr:hypothetical protein BB559_002194 [Furculomyces boomerangus]
MHRSQPKSLEAQLNKIASTSWNLPNFKPDQKVISRILNDFILDPENSEQSIEILENKLYFEKYLYPHFNKDDSSRELLISIVVFLNKKCTEPGVFISQILFDPSFSHPDTNSEAQSKTIHLLGSIFDTFFNLLEKNIVNQSTINQSEIILRQFLLVFILNCFRNVDSDPIRNQMLTIVTIGIWRNVISKEERKQIFDTYPTLKKLYKISEKKHKNVVETGKANSRDSLIPFLIQDYINIILSIGKDNDLIKTAYCEQFIDFLTELISQLPTRRFLKLVIKKYNVSLITQVKLSPLGKDYERILKLVENLEYYENFPVDDFTGKSITDFEYDEDHYRKLQEFQVRVFQGFGKVPHMRSMSLSSIGKLSSQEYLEHTLNNLKVSEILTICELLNSKPPNPSDIGFEENSENYRNFVILYTIKLLSLGKNKIKEIQSLPLYPTEKDIFDDSFEEEKLISKRNNVFSNMNPLSLPKLNLQFLSMNDYLMRNFTLYRLESTYQIRLDVEDAIKRLNPQFDEDPYEPMASNQQVVFPGWSRMATPIQSFEISEILKPNVGEVHPSAVRGTIFVDLSQYTEQIRRDWNSSIKPLDTLFLISIRTAYDGKKDISSIKPFFTIRGCQIEAFIGADGKPIVDYENVFTSKKAEDGSNINSIQVLLDPIQYYKDLRSGNEPIYSSFNVLMRRRAKENNFRSILLAINDLIQNKMHVPQWLHSVFLGFGDPKSVSPLSKLDEFEGSINFNDTFIDVDHIKEIFDGDNVENLDASILQKNPTFTLEFSPPKKGSSRDILIKPHKLPNKGPYTFNIPQKNRIRFTKAQVKAIMSASQPGLTVIVGPPGTGKTDVAVQIISNLYHNFPNQKTLLITHSNQALNQLFDKILDLDIEQRHLLRLGHGEEELNSDERFTKAGRVDMFLAHRSDLLNKVSFLAQTLGISGDVGYTCETAGYFYISQILTRWNSFEDQIQNYNTSESLLSFLNEKFPFSGFFSDLTHPLFSETESVDELIEISHGCFKYIQSIFTELDEMRPFELLRSNYDRSNYLLLNEARIIAMTCTHAALKKQDFSNLGFSYDNIVIEEAAQILEIETFIPLTLNSSLNHSQLKRVVMLGDHNQLPPVVKNTVLRYSCNLDQSIFARFVRLGVPTILLDHQGRSRPEFVDLFRWKYPGLQDLSTISSNPEYLTANAGFAYSYQLIDVPSERGSGESEPVQYFYQNRDEAEYAVAIYQYMRLIGYPKEKITILTTYNGQKALITDILGLRCGSNPIFGIPSVSTVDQFQGNQSDYIILSLVRTRSVGHIRDIRRLVVALSRARLGLYILGNAKLFSNCSELTNVFDLLMKRPTTLSIVLDEVYKTERKVDEIVPFPKDSKTKAKTKTKKSKSENNDSSIEYSIKSFESVSEFGNFVYEKSTEAVLAIKEASENIPEIEMGE